MYAIIETGSKQYRVKEGDIIDVELLGVENGNNVQFPLLYLSEEEGKHHVGTPNVAGWMVEGEVMGEAKGDKVIAFKYKRRKSCHIKQGHRQKYTRIKITKISKAKQAA